MSLNSNALTTVATAKSYLKIPALETSQDALIEMFINASSDALESECDRVLKQKTVTEYQHGRGQNIILLRQFPVATIAELRIDSKSVFTDASTLIAATDYFLTDDDSGILLKNRVFDKGYHNIKIVYDGGYAPVPADLEHACLWLVFWYTKIRNSEDIGRAAKSKDGETVSYLQSMPGDVLATIARHKRTEFPQSNAMVRNV